jgi:3-dehydroquinate synthase
VNHPLGKNLVGAFYQPRLVYTDVKVLESLDRRNFISGLAEVVKYGVIADAEFFNFLERYLPRIIARNPYYLLPAIRRSCEIKAQVVQEDEREGGLRKILNYGHTLGHALETVTLYKRYLHGEAISIGMAFAARLAYDLGLCDEKAVQRQETLLSRADLPISLPKNNPSSILQAMSHDKKVKQGEIHFILADKIGHVLIKKVNASQIRKLL